MNDIDNIFLLSQVQLAANNEFIGFGPLIVDYKTSDRHKLEITTIMIIDEPHMEIQYFYNGSFDYWHVAPTEECVKHFSDWLVNHEQA
jgi:hypothetical protein